MTEKLREQLSALADNELPDGQHELLLRRFAVDKELCRCWERYHAMGEAMRKTLPDADTRGFADRVMAQLLDEPAPAQESPRLAVRMTRAFAGAAVAASVAVVAIVGLRHDTHRTLDNGVAAEIVPEQTALQPAPISYGLVNSASWDTEMAPAQASLRSYLVNRGSAGGFMNRQGLPPNLYIVTRHPNPEARKIETVQEPESQQNQ